MAAAMRMHDKRCYVKLTQNSWRRPGLLVLPLIALCLVSPGRAGAELLYPGRADDARLASGTDGTTVAFAVGTRVELRTRGSRGWTSTGAVTFRSALALDGVARLRSGRVAILARGRDGSWLELWDGRRRWSFHRDAVQARFGPAGLTLDASGRPVVAYALWFPSRRTFLRIGRIRANGRLTVQRLTREGFPQSSAPPAAAPVVLGSGEIRVVETYVPAGLEWRFEDGDWWGKLLHQSARGFPFGRISAVASGSTVYAAWNEAFPTLSPPGVVLATRSDRARSVLALEDASLAALAVTPAGPELAANRCIPAAAFGIDGDGVCGGLVAGAGVDGVVADYAGAGTRRQVLLQGANGLQWFSSPAPFVDRVTFTPDFHGRVEGASGGTVAIYRERPGERSPFADLPLAPDGTFAMPAPVDALATAYRAVYTDSSTGIPYAALTGP